MIRLAEAIFRFVKQPKKNLSSIDKILERENIIVVPPKPYIPPPGLKGIQ